MLHYECASDLYLDELRLVLMEDRWFHFFETLIVQNKGINSNVRWLINLFVS